MDLRALMEQEQPKGNGSGSGSGSGSGRQASDERSVAPLNKPHYRLQRFIRRYQRQLGEGRRRQAGEEAHGEVVKLYNKAAWALVGRACTLLTVYYLPTYLVFGCLGLYHVRAEHTAQRRCCAAND